MHGQEVQFLIDLLFKTIFLSKLTHAVSRFMVLATVTRILTSFKAFLRNSPKTLYISHDLNIYDLLEKSDRKLFSKLSKNELHPSYFILPTANDSSYSFHLQLPLDNTERF